MRARTTIGLCLAVAATLLAAACGTQRKAVSDAGDDRTLDVARVVERVEANQLRQNCVTAKLKFTAEVGGRQVQLGGQLRMRRNDVVRIQLMALGIVEAGRLEFTPDYVLLMDRINKQYVKAAYDKVDFLQQNGIGFDALQALFWNRLFMPGASQIEPWLYNAMTTDGDVVLTVDKGSLAYSWLTDGSTATLKSTRVVHRDAQMSWDYSNFKNIEKRPFPCDMDVVVKTSSRELKLGFALSGINGDEDWEARTTVSKKYREVTVDDILQKLMAL